jgi:hypothetical protein
MDRAAEIFSTQLSLPHRSLLLPKKHMNSRLRSLIAFLLLLLMEGINYDEDE